LEAALPGPVGLAEAVHKPLFDKVLCQLCATFFDSTV
jgi:hypothetical protein